MVGLTVRGRYHFAFREAQSAGDLAFRGATALYKLHLTPAARYSEDIDLVQTRAAPAGSMMDALRAVLDLWLGQPQWKPTAGRVTFTYRFLSENTPPLRNAAAAIVLSRLIQRLAGEPWKGEG